MPGRDFAHVQDDVNLHILRISESTFSLDAVRLTVFYYIYTRVLQKVFSLGSNYFSATFYQTYVYYKPSKYSPFTETHFCNLFTQSRKADK